MVKQARLVSVRVTEAGFNFLEQSGLSEELDSRFSLKCFAYQCQSLGSKSFECADNSMFPYCTVLAGWNKMAFHHARKVSSTSGPVGSQILPGQLLSDHLVIARNEETNIT